MYKKEMTRRARNFVAAPHLPSLGLALALMAGTMGAASAQMAASSAAIDPSEYPKIAFDAADTNDDGLISEGEFVRDAAVGFATLDKDGSRTLTPAELEAHDPAKFKAIDKNGDGKLTFSEVMANKMRAFKAGDTNQDGFLSFEEMMAIVEKEQ